MLLIAIPKSASTSLARTLKGRHNLRYIECSVLGKEIKGEEIRSLSDDKGVLYKEHIYPNEKNLAELKDIKKVVLLRDPKECREAVKRAIKGMMNREDDPIANVDFEGFEKKWREGIDENTLLINYRDLIGNPKETVNKIERFWGLEESDRVRLVKARYSNSYPRKILRTLFYHVRRIPIARWVKRRFFPKVNFYTKPDAKTDLSANELK